METQKPEQKIINLNDLDVNEVLDFNPDHDEAEIDQTFSQVVKAQAPDSMTFCGDSTLFVLDGFTQGAIKNLLRVSKGHIVRLYSVTLDSIDVLSHSELATEEVKLILKSRLQNGSQNTSSMEAIQNIHDCSVQLIPMQSNLSILLTFNQKTGSLLKEEVCKFSEQTDITQVRALEINNPRNSLTDSFALAQSYTEITAPFGGTRKEILNEFVKF